MIHDVCRYRGRLRPLGLVLLVLGFVGAAHDTPRDTPLALAQESSQQPAAAQQVTHGVAAGDVTATSAVIWARASGASVLRVSVQPDTAAD
jgi:alkaline phosphatase D